MNLVLLSWVSDPSTAFCNPERSELFFQPNMSLFLIRTFFIWIAISVAIVFRVFRKFTGCVRIAKTIFKTSACPDPEHIDLRQASKDNRREKNRTTLGIFISAINSLL